MAGRKRLDAIEEKITRIERDRGGDVVAAWVRTLTCDQIAEIRRRLEAGEAPETVVKEFHR